MLRDSTSVSHYFNLGLVLKSERIAVQKDEFVGILDLLWYEVYRAISSLFQGEHKMSQSVNVNISTVFHKTTPKFFKERIVRSANAVLVGFLVEQNFSASSYGKFFII